MPFTKKIAAFDLDGTLTESKLPMTPSMAFTLSDLAKVAIVAVISGGSFQQFKKQLLGALELSDADLSHLILLPTSGSQRYEYDAVGKGWKLTDKEDLSEDLKKKILEGLKEIESSNLYDLPVEIFGERTEERGTQITFSGLGQQAPIEKKRLWDPEQLKRKKIKEALEHMIPEVDIRIGGMTSIDILHKGFDKSVGLRRLLSKLDMKIEDMIFVGDAVFPGGNDYSPSQAGIETVSIRNPAETETLIKRWLAS